MNENGQGNKEDGKLKITARLTICAIMAITAIMPLTACASDDKAKDGYPEFEDEVKKPMRELLLDPSMIYDIYVPIGDQVTTIMFPSPIDGIYAANVVRNVQKNDNGEIPGDFRLTYTDGSYYFSVNALRPNSKGSLNVIYNRKTYVIRLINVYEVDNKRSFPVNVSVSFASPGTQSIGHAGMKKKVTPSLLISLLEVARCYDLFARYHPEKLRNAQRAHPADLISEYEKFNVKVEDVFRFDNEDTLVFRVLLMSKVDEQLVYEPDTLAVRLGDKIYYASMTDAAGTIPPKGVMPAYFSITGTPTGGRNELRPDNKWRILVATKDMDYNPTTKVEDKTSFADQRIPSILDEEMVKLAGEIANAGSQEELDKLKAQATSIQAKIDALKQQGGADSKGKGQ